MKVVVSKEYELPHVITKNNVTYQFAPVAEVPDEYAKSLIKTYPGRFKEATGKETAEGYKFKETFKKQAVIDMFNALTGEEKGKVVAYINTLHEEREGTGSNEGDGIAYADMKVPELKKLIEERGIETDATKKDELVAALEAADAAKENA
jgi:hypothetical protein